MTSPSLLNIDLEQFFSIALDSSWQKPCLLFSCEPNDITDQDQAAQFHIFSANPSDNIEINQQEQWLDFKIKLSKQTQHQHHNLPFQSGWMGYFDYPELSKQNNHKIKGKKAIGIDAEFCGEFHYYDWSLIFCTTTNECFLYEGKLNTQQALIEALLNKKATDTSKTNIANFSCEKFQPLWQFSDYQNAFNKVQDYLKSGDCYQVNLTQAHQAQFSGDPRACIPDIINQLNPSFGGFFQGREKSILSASPERFIQIKDNQIETKPIKGTIKTQPDLSADHAAIERLKGSDKDKAENLMIVDLLRNDIGQLAVTGSVKVDKLFAIESHPYVHHLVSTISAEKKPNISNLEVLISSLPGGSITGAPKKRAMEIIEELEIQPRSAYCGSLGYFSDNGDCDFNILIRTLEFGIDGKVTCWGGGGITIASTLESEHQESLDKVEKLMQLISSK